MASDLDIGYFEKQGNAKRWIEDQEDLDAMYAAVSVGEEVTLWCNGRPSEEQKTKSGKKRKSSEIEGNATQSSKRQIRMRKSTQLFSSYASYMRKSLVAHNTGYGLE